MKTFLVPVVLIIFGHTEGFDIKRLHPVGSHFEDASALKENGRHSAVPKIIGGVSASLGEIPFQVSVDVDGYWFNGGAIIHPWYILTNAFYAPEAKTFTIYAGVIKRHGDESSRQVMVATEKYVHEDFNKTTMQANIALLKLPTGLEFNHGEYAPTLQVAKVTIISNEECLKAWPDYVVSSTLCTAAEYGVGECNGDAGGPLFTNSTVGTRSLLVGIVNFHAASSCGKEPDVYTRVSSYRQWIENHIE